MDRINASWARIGQPQIPQSPVPPVLAPQPDGLPIREGVARRRRP